MTGRTSGGYLSSGRALTARAIICRDLHQQPRRSRTTAAVTVRWIMASTVACRESWCSARSWVQRQSGQHVLGEDVIGHFGVGALYLDLDVQPARPQDRRVDHVLAVGDSPSADGHELLGTVRRGGEELTVAMASELPGGSDSS